MNTVPHIQTRVDTSNQVMKIANSIVRLLPQGPLLVTVEEYKEPKTNPQLRRLHAIIRDFATHLDISPKVAKVRAKIKLGFYEFVEVPKSELNPDGIHCELGSFGDASKDEVSAWVDELQALAIEWSVPLKDHK